MQDNNKKQIDEKQIDEKIKEYIKIKFKKHDKIIYAFLIIIILVFIYIIFFNKNSNVYIKSNVKNSDVMSILLNEMGSMNSRISSEVGWVMTIVSIVMGGVGFYSYNQWKMSSNQIDNLRKEFKDQFHIDFMQQAIKEMKNNSFIQEEEINKTKSLNKEFRNKINKMDNKVKELKKELKANKKELRIEGFEKIAEKKYGKEDRFSIVFDILRMKRYLINMENEHDKCNEAELTGVIADVAITLWEIINSGIEKDEFHDGIDEEVEKLVEILKRFADEFNSDVIKGQVKKLEEAYSTLFDEMKKD